MLKTEDDAKSIQACVDRVEIDFNFKHFAAIATPDLHGRYVLWNFMTKSLLIG